MHGSHVTPPGSLLTNQETLLVSLDQSGLSSKTGDNQIQDGGQTRHKHRQYQSSQQRKNERELTKLEKRIKTWLENEKEFRERHQSTSLFTAFSDPMVSI